MTLAENKAAVIDAATEAINARMNVGAGKYDPNDWRAVKHAITAMEIADGDRTNDGEDHLAAAVCRLAMAVAVSRESEAAVA